MISNKDVRIEGKNLIINGEKHPLDPAANALIKRANTVQGKLSALGTKITAIEALEKTASGNPISLTGVAEAYAMALSMTIEPIQSGSGDPSPTNVRPISGISEAVVTRMGKNLICGRIVGKVVSSSGVFVSSNESTTYYAKVIKGATYRITNHDLYNQLLYAYFYEEPTVASVSYNQARTVEENSDFIVTAPITGYIAFRVYNSVDNETQIELGTTATDYEAPVTPATATITFGQTVYGGSVNFKTGEVTVTHANIASYNGESINEPWLSSLDKYESGATPTTGAQVVYPLTTPTTLTLTPAELKLLKGNNTITANGANINLSYIGR